MASGWVRDGAEPGPWHRWVLAARVLGVPSFAVAAETLVSTRFEQAPKPYLNLRGFVFCNHAPDVIDVYFQARVFWRRGFVSKSDVALT